MKRHPIKLSLLASTLMLLASCASQTAATGTVARTSGNDVDQWHPNFMPIGGGVGLYQGPQPIGDSR